MQEEKRTRVACILRIWKVMRICILQICEIGGKKSQQKDATPVTEFLEIKFARGIFGYLNFPCGKIPVFWGLFLEACLGMWLCKNILYFNSRKDTCFKVYVSLYAVHLRCTTQKKGRDIL